MSLALLSDSLYRQIVINESIPEIAGDLNVGISLTWRVRSALRERQDLNYHYSLWLLCLRASWCGDYGSMGGLWMKSWHLSAYFNRHRPLGWICSFAQILWKPSQGRKQALSSQSSSCLTGTLLRPAAQVLTRLRKRKEPRLVYGRRLSSQSSRKCGDREKSLTIQAHLDRD